MQKASNLESIGLLALALGCGSGASAATVGVSGTAGLSGVAGVSGLPEAAAGRSNTGGAGAAGGASPSGAESGGAAGAPVPSVTNCTALGPVDAWENITPPAFNPRTYNVLSVVADPITAGTVYMGTNKGGLWRSTDCGANWTKVNTGRSASAIDSGGLWIVLADPSAGNALYAGSLYGSDPSLLRSTNGGQDWDSVFPAGSVVAKSVQYNFFQDAGIDPTNPRHIVASFHSDCTGDTGPMCLAESADSGKTWRLFKGPTKAWVERAGVLVFDATSFIYHTYQDGMFYTHDDGVTWERVADAGNFEAYHAADGSYYLGSVYGMLHSKDAHVWDKISGSPNGDVLAGDGTRMFVAWGDTNPQFRVAMESDPTVWTTWPTPASFTDRVAAFDYDSAHHILYSANITGGLWRVVTVKQ